MFLKSKSLIVVLVLAVACAAGGAWLVSQSITESKSFAQGGFVLADKQVKEDGGYTTVQATFDAGANYSASNQTNKLTFQNPAHEKKVVENYGFVHYNDGSTTALKPGVLLDLGGLKEGSTTASNTSVGTAVTSNGSNFGIEHMGETKPLESPLWKLSASKYIVMGQTLSLQLSDGSPQTFKDFVEVNYIDDGVIQIADAETTVLTISPVALLTVNNGPVVDLYNGVVANDKVQLQLASLLVGDEDNIDITKVEKESLADISIPTFTVIQGVNGQNGNAGTSGERGISGDNGSSGSEGASGSSGVGSDDGSDNGSGNPNPVEQFVKPVFELKKFEYNTTSVSGEVVISDPTNGGTLVANSTVMRIVDVATGATIFTQENVSNNAAEGVPWEFNYTDLRPGRTYKLTISGQYRVSNTTGTDEIYTTDFISKIITADNVGAQLLKVEGATATDSVTVNLRKEVFSGAGTAILEIWQEGATSALNNSGIMNLSAGDNNFTFSGLTPNTKYTVKVNPITVNYNDGITPDSNIANYAQIDITTLQELTTALVAAPRVFANNPNMTITAQPGTITGILANSIVEYHYEFRQTAKFDATVPPQPTANVPSDMFLSSSTNGPVIANVSPQSNNSNPELLNWNTDYRVRLILDVNDNEKIVEYASEWSSAAGLWGNMFPIVTYMPNHDGAIYPPQYDWVVGQMRIDPNGSTIRVSPATGQDPAYPLDLVFESTSTMHTVTVPVANLAGIPISGNETIAERKNPFTIPVDQQYLEAGTPYKVTVYAYVDLDARGRYEKVAIGTFSVLTLRPSTGGLHMTSITNPAGHSFAVDMYIDDYSGLSATEDFKYEASNLAYLELELYFGILQPGDTTRQPDRTARISSTSLIPGQSTLGKVRDANMNYSNTTGYLYGEVDALRTFKDLGGNATPTGTATGGVRITEALFGLTTAQAAGIPTMTLMVRRATDYTAGAPSANLFVNTLPLINDENGMRTDGINGIDLYTVDSAPTPPPDGEGFVNQQTQVIYEVDRGSYLPDARSDQALTTPLPSTVREGYDPQTAVGLRAQAGFTTPEIADTFTYTLWRTKTDNNGIYVNTAPNVPNASLAVSEIDNANREKVIEVVVPVYHPNSSTYEVPKLSVGFGRGISNLPTGNVGGDNSNNNQRNYYVYLASVAGAASPGKGETLIAGYNSEDDGRGYHYYFTYTADLTSHLADPNVPGATFIYPKDCPPDTSGRDYATLQLTSHRLSVPRQQLAFKTWPATSNATGESWKYRLNMLDSGVLTDSAGIAIPSSGGGSQYDNALNLSNGANSYQVTVTATPPSSTSWSSFTLSPLTANSVYELTYYEKLYEWATTPLTRSMLNLWHRAELTRATMESYLGTAAISSNPARNALFVSYPSITAANSARLDPIAGVWVTIRTNTTGGTTSTYKELLDIRLDNPSTDASAPQVAAVEIPLASLSALGFKANNNLIIEAQVLFDTGTSGWDYLNPNSTNWNTGNNTFALQSQGPSATAAGSYQTPGTVVGSFAASSAASGSAYYSSADATALGGTSGQLTLDAASPYNGLISYLSVSRALFAGNLQLDFTNNPARGVGSAGSVIKDTTTAITAKVLDKTAVVQQSLTMPAVIPQISDYAASPHPTGADVTFRLDGVEVLNLPAEFHIQLFMVDRNGGPDVPVSSDWPSGTAPGSSTGPGGTPNYLCPTDGNYSVSFTDLMPDTTYRFRVYGNSVTLQQTFPTPDIGAAGYFFYDAAQLATGRYYTFTTISSVVIGGADAQGFSADFYASNYDNKYLRMRYSLSTNRGFRMQYRFTDLSAGSVTLGPIASTVGVYQSTTTEDIPIGAQSLNYNSFFKPGHQYSVTIEAISNNGQQVLGSFTPAPFTIRQLVKPTFIVTAAPYWDIPQSQSELDVTIAVNDPDYTIVGSSYRLAILRQGQTTATVWDTHPTSPAVTTTNYWNNIVAGVTYNTEVYAAVNTANVFPYPNVMPDSYDSAVLNTPITTPDAQPNGFFQKAVAVTAVDANTVRQGNVTASVLPNGDVQLTFDNSINLNTGSVPYIQYTITSIATGNVVPLTTRTFNPVDVGTGAGAYKTFTLAGVGLSVAGKYFIEYRLVNNSLNLVGPDTFGTVTAIK